MESISAVRLPKTGRTLLDEVIYLASLASDRQVIDPILETVRNITSNLQTGSALTDRDQVNLQSVRSQLADHLLHHDTLRTFTEEELNQQVAEAIGIAAKKRESLLMVIKILVVAVTSYPIGVAVFHLAHLPSPLLLAGSFTATALYIGLVWLYLSALSTFTPQLRSAYRWLCASLLILDFAGASSVVMGVFPAIGNIPLLSYGGPVIDFGVVGIILGYEGVRRFAKAVDIRSFMTSWPITLIGSIACFGLTFIVPHVSMPNEVTFRIAIMPWLLLGYFGLMVTILALRSATLVTKLYARAIRWVAIAYTQASAVSLVSLALILTSGPVYSGEKLLIIVMCFGTSGASLITAGYMFSRSVGKS